MVFILGCKKNLIVIVKEENLFKVFWFPRIIKYYFSLFHFTPYIDVNLSVFIFSREQEYFPLNESIMKVNDLQSSDGVWLGKVRVIGGLLL